MVGWAIEQGKTVIIQEGKQEVVKFKESLEGGGGGGFTKEAARIGALSFFS